MIDLTHAMVLAAGLGTRMRPLTDDMPKPMLDLGGRSLLDHALDRLAAAGVTQAVVNAHWRADRVAEAMSLRDHPCVALQREEALLETGGGVARALPLLGDAPFAVVNGDAFWLDGPTPALRRLAAAFDPAQMDALLLMVRTTQVDGAVGLGDFLLDPLGRMRRPKEREIAPYLYAGVQILSPALFEGAPSGAFSLNRLYDRAVENGRLFGLVHDGVWFHLSTPEDLRYAEETLRAGLVRALF
ncbi:nucleotidyltransferase family protein [Roseomonas sp. CECT 9278]|uniref:nucleotidyltransferase family protein n=1 Tax=Roseomonas sp. CECT 9278 TaxID=2845823 RepID=UPI001E2F6E24|nr:nucleotidyltransferase family protein [Roseomonas sp. CECT 9278]CAH0190342.1 N-acetylmuramate alpha-1-phosphate uridylyltransferase [Roseomonas sp. CECT 9278]